MTNILFICRHNRFRSRVAEAYLKKIASNNPHIHVKSAGLIKGFYPLSLNQSKIANQNGLDIEGHPRGLSMNLLRWADYHIIVADDVPESLFNNSEKFGKKLIVWKIPDAHSKNIAGIKNSIAMIKEKIDKFYKKLI